LKKLGIVLSDECARNIDCLRKKLKNYYIPTPEAIGKDAKEFEEKESQSQELNK